MKKLFVAASVAAGLAACAVPAFAQSTMTSQPGSVATADNGALNYTPSSNYTQSQPTISTTAHIGDGSRPNYLMRQQQLRDMPGYSPGGTD